MVLRRVRKCDFNSAIQILEELLFIALMEKFEEDGILDIIRKNLVAFVTGKIGEFTKN